MMKNVKRMTTVTALLLVTTMMLSMFCGCTETPKEETHTALIMSYTKSSPTPDIAKAVDKLKEACLTFGSVTLLNDEGTVSIKNFDIPEQEALSKSNLDKIAEQQIREIVAAAASLKATTEEVNTLGALQLASRSLSSVTGHKELVIIGSCLPTTGALKFTSLNNIDADAIVNDLAATGDIPDLTDVNVHIYNCGDVSGDQTPIGESNRKALQTLWKTICEKGGAASVEVSDAPAVQGASDATLPNVTPVTVSVPQKEVTDVEKMGKIFKKGGVISYDEEAFLFKGDEAVLLDREKALNALAPLIEYLQTETDTKLLVCGTTASAEREAYVMELSAARAKTIVDLLVAQGVSAERLESIGVGCYSEYYQYDRLPSGGHDESIAYKNRSVKVMAADSDAAATLKAVAQERGY